MSEACLYIVATPIGNLEDVTLRALRVLREAGAIAAEDTRHSRLLLAHHGIERPLVALHEHNEEAQAPRLLQRIRAGESVALISDAGTPLLSDPGYRLVRLAIEQGVPVVPVPGPSAVTAALSVCGLPTDRFAFEGFLPAKSAARRGRLQALNREDRTLVLFETGRRLEDCFADLEEAFGSERAVAVCRELTKRFETVLRGTLAEVRARIAADADQRRGEFVLVVAGAGAAPQEGLADALELARVLREHLGASQAARVAAQVHGVPRRELYRLLEV